jgi:hypothetical protein
MFMGRATASTAEVLIERVGPPPRTRVIKLYVDAV